MSRTRDAEELAKFLQKNVLIEQEHTEAAEQQTQPTSLNEHIPACHSLASAKLTVETDRRLTSKGSITNPRNKLCLANLRP